MRKLQIKCFIYLKHKHGHRRNGKEEDEDGKEKRNRNGIRRQKESEKEREKPLHTTTMPSKSTGSVLSFRVRTRIPECVVNGFWRKSV